MLQRPFVATQHFSITCLFPDYVASVRSLVSSVISFHTFAVLSTARYCSWKIRHYMYPMFQLQLTCRKVSSSDTTHATFLQFLFHFKILTILYSVLYVLYGDNPQGTLSLNIFRSGRAYPSTSVFSGALRETAHNSAPSIRLTRGARYLI